MTISNKAKGSKFEDLLCEKLSGVGYWARPMYPAPDGSQPFDVMAISPKGELYVFENKTNVGKSFSLSRLEDNQIINLSYMSEVLGKDKVWLCFKRKDDTIWFTKYSDIDFSKKSIPSGKITYEEFIDGHRGVE